jgi:hypothetical protein
VRYGKIYRCLYTRKLLSMCFKLFQDIFILAFMSIRFTSELIFHLFYIPVIFSISLCDLLLQLHFEFSLKLSYTSSEYKLELVQPIWHIFFTSLTRIFLFKMSHLEFCSLILIVLCFGDALPLMELVH